MLFFALIICCFQADSGKPTSVTPDGLTEITGAFEDSLSRFQSEHTARFIGNSC